MLPCGSKLCHGMFSMVHDFTCSTCVVGLVLHQCTTICFGIALAMAVAGME